MEMEGVMDDEVYKLVGFDANGIRRVWACNYTREDAQKHCMSDAREYVQRRPDTGPLTGWRFEWK